MQSIVGLKELRENIDTYAKQVRRGRSFLVMRKSTPLFTMVPPDYEEQWESVVDFTKMKKGGISLDDVLARL